MASTPNLAGYPGIWSKCLGQLQAAVDGYGGQTYIQISGKDVTEGYPAMIVKLPSNVRGKNS